MWGQINQMAERQKKSQCALPLIEIRVFLSFDACVQNTHAQETNDSVLVFRAAAQRRYSSCRILPLML